MVQEGSGHLTSGDPRECIDAMVTALDEAALEIASWQDNRLPAGQTTAVVSQLVEWQGVKYLTWVSVGDSRLYIRQGNTLQQMTHDEGEGKDLYNAIGRDFEGVGQSGIVELSEAVDTEVVLMTDGVSGHTEDTTLSDQEILDCLLDGGSATEAAEKLTEIAREQDDRSVIVMRLAAADSLQSA